MKTLGEYSYEDLREIIEDVRTCYQWYITRDGRIFSACAENFLSCIEEYSMFCVPEVADLFKKEIRYLVYHPKVPKLIIEDKEKSEKIRQIVEDNTKAIIYSLYDYINACQIVEVYTNTNSWDEVENKLHEQGHSGYTFAGLSNILIEYFPIGVEFIDKFDPSRPKRDNVFKKYYLNMKEKIQSECLMI